MDLFGPGRSHVGRNHAFITPDSFVRSPMPGWESTECVILIAPRMGARFTQFLAHMQPGGTAGPSAPGVERVVYVLDGTLKRARRRASRNATLTAGGFAFAPAGIDLRLRAETGCRLNVFEKRYVSRPGMRRPAGDRRPRAGRRGPAVPRRSRTPGCTSCCPTSRRSTSRSTSSASRPGRRCRSSRSTSWSTACSCSKGQGVYRLGESWYPVRAGDVIWMASFCPQWFVAMGKTPAAYLYYKDVNRDPLGADA